MNIRGLLLALAVSVACSSDALAGFVNGNVLNSWIQAWARVQAGDPQLGDFAFAFTFEGYVQGVSDSLELQVGNLSLCGLNVVGQVSAVVAQYVEAHPEKWGHSAALLISAAIADACKKNRHQ
jgi:hypothetical protein